MAFHIFAGCCEADRHILALPVAPCNVVFRLVLIAVFPEGQLSYIAMRLKRLRRDGENLLHLLLCDAHGLRLAQIVRAGQYVFPIQRLAFRHGLFQRLVIGGALGKRAVIRVDIEIQLPLVLPLSILARGQPGARVHIGLNLPLPPDLGAQIAALPFGPVHAVVRPRCLGFAAFGDGHGIRAGFSDDGRGEGNGPSVVRFLYIGNKHTHGPVGQPVFFHYGLPGRALHGIVARKYQLHHRECRRGQQYHRKPKREHRATPKALARRGNLLFQTRLDTRHRAFGFSIPIQTVKPSVHNPLKALLHQNTTLSAAGEASPSRGSGARLPFPLGYLALR